MYDIHHFFTPLLDEFTEFDNNNWYLSPVVTLAAAKELRDLHRLPKTIENLNVSFEILEKISKDFLIINLHGRKYGRKFLIELQNRLAVLTILDYNDGLRQEIIEVLGLARTDFLVHQNFAQQQLIEATRDFYKNGFVQAPASLVYTGRECLKFDSCSQRIIQNYLSHIEKTA